MLGPFLVMGAMEISLLIDKPNARYFAVTILAVGLILRGLVQERRAKKEAKPLLVPAKLSVDTQSGVAIARGGSSSPLFDVNLGTESILCAIRGTGRTLDFAL